MSTYTLKSVFRRGTMLGLAVALGLATVLPAASTFADALNPLTERSLTLSSSSPGWSSKDGSGNTTYAEPNSGANGEKTGNTFSFRVSSSATLKALTFQYCTTPAGFCQGPGNNTGNGATRAANDPTSYAAKQSDLEVKLATPTEISAPNYTALFNTTSGAPSSVANVPNRDNSEGNFIVLHKTGVNDPWQRSTGAWTMEASDVQDATTTTDKPNFITLKSSAGQVLAANDYVKVIFVGTDTNYIINPGADAFFVKINTYDDDTTQDENTLVDGGVTVANIMNLSIEIQTKVLETMDFSVGTVDPYTLDTTDGTGAAGGAGTSQFKDAMGVNTRGTCDPILKGMQGNNTAKPNILQLGDANGEFSLKTTKTYSTHSYWRLSSNSSAGATVYYSGVTLSNTVGDQIEAIGKTKKDVTRGSEQFGLALDNGSDFTGSSKYLVSYAKERDNGKEYQNGADNAVTDVSPTVDTELGANPSYHAPQLAPLTPAADYNQGTGDINADYTSGVATKFAFDPESSLIPTPIASESDQVVDCVTGKMRYIANIAATTPAGIYTTKINYVAAPMY